MNAIICTYKNLTIYFNTEKELFFVPFNLVHPSKEYSLLIKNIDNYVPKDIGTIFKIDHIDTTNWTTKTWDVIGLVNTDKGFVWKAVDNNGDEHILFQSNLWRIHDAKNLELVKKGKKLHESINSLYDLIDKIENQLSDNFLDYVDKTLYLR